jgi:hypothetical protein
MKISDCATAISPGPVLGRVTRMDIFHAARPAPLAGPPTLRRIDYRQDWERG